MGRDRISDLQISLSLVFGRIGDIYGRQTIFGLGLVISAIGAMLCGLSQNIFAADPVSIVPGHGRFHDAIPSAGVGHGFMPKESAGKAQGFMTTAFHTGVLIGPSIGGLIIEYISWRAVFFFLVPIALAGVALTLFNRNNMNTPAPANPSAPQPVIDYLGAVLLV